MDGRSKSGETRKGACFPVFLFTTNLVAGSLLFVSSGISLQRIGNPFYNGGVIFFHAGVINLSTISLPLHKRRPFMRTRFALAVALPILSGLPAWAQGEAPAVDSQPAASNIAGQPYPRIHADLRAAFV